MATITITNNWHTAVIKVGSFKQEYSLPGGFKKYIIVEHLRKANCLERDMTFNDTMIGFTALYAYIVKHS